MGPFAASARRSKRQSAAGSPPDVYKRQAQGLRALCGILKIDPGEVLALGDNHNDAGMLRLAGIGVAMGNATKEALQAADYVTAACDKDGAAGAIERFVLNACAGKDDLVGVADLSREGL